MEKCIVPIKLETEKDVYFGIANTILSYDKKKEFVEEDIVEELQLLGWDEEVFEKWPISKMIKTSIQNLIEHQKILEEPRCYILRESA